MVSIDHANAEFYFNRDVQCVRTFFQRRFHFDGEHWPQFGDVQRRHNLDIELEASGFTKQMRRDLNKVSWTAVVTFNISTQTFFRLMMRGISPTIWKQMRANLLPMTMRRRKSLKLIR